MGAARHCRGGCVTTWMHVAGDGRQKRNRGLVSGPAGAGGSLFSDSPTSERVRSGQSAGGTVLLRRDVAGGGRGAFFQRQKPDSKFSCGIAKLLRSAQRKGAEPGSARLASLFALPWPDCPWILVPVGSKAQCADWLLRPDQRRGHGTNRTADTPFTRCQSTKSPDRCCGSRGRYFGRLRKNRRLHSFL